MERLNASPTQQYQQLKPYDPPVKHVNYHGPARNKTWCFYTAMGIVMFLLFLYLPVYHQIQQTRIEKRPNKKHATSSFNTSASPQPSPKWIPSSIQPTTSFNPPASLPFSTSNHQQRTHQVPKSIKAPLMRKLMKLHLRSSSIKRHLEKKSVLISHLTTPLPVAVHGWNYNTSRDAKEYVLPENLTSLQRPSDFCETDLFLLVIVCSAPRNVEARDAIRETWASETNFNGTLVKFSFLLGETYNMTLQDQLFEENRKHDDIIQERFLDTYNNLTLKSVMMLKLVNNHCIERVKFLMKIDDDMYLNMVPLINLLKSKLNRKRQLIGCLICGARPITDTNNKWYAPKYMYSDRMYPNYLSGTGYVMSVDVVQSLYEAAFITPLFHLEDIYITGMCARRAKIKPHNHASFTFATRRFDPCVYKDHITSHRVTPSGLRKMFALLKSYEETELNRTCRQRALYGNATGAAAAVATTEHLRMFNTGGLTLTLLIHVLLLCNPPLMR